MEYELEQSKKSQLMGHELSTCQELVALDIGLSRIMHIVTISEKQMLILWRGRLMIL